MSGGTAPRTFVYVVGARPNFMKMAPVLEAMRALAPDDRHILVHTGQHYDDRMSAVFLEQLGMPQPDHHLGVGAGAPGAQTARVIDAVERLMVADPPDILVVAGDVNSTLGAALAAAKQNVRVAHVEAGLRSFDRAMPEELNRILTDRIADLHFIHSPTARDHLIAEGIDTQSIHHSGNTMIDSVLRLLPQATPDLRSRHVGAGPYVLVTLHRPGLVDGPLLRPTIEALSRLAQRVPVVFPVHPRTQARVDEMQLPTEGMTLLPPLGYLEFLSLERAAAAVLTDSGGVQEETSVLGVPCFTLRDTTERPVTVDAGTNVLLGLRPDRVEEISQHLERPRPVQTALPEGWDGTAARRLASVLDAAVSPGTPQRPTGA